MTMTERFSATDIEPSQRCASQANQVTTTPYIVGREPALAAQFLTAGRALVIDVALRSEVTAVSSRRVRTGRGMSRKRYAAR